MSEETSHAVTSSDLCEVKAQLNSNKMIPRQSTQCSICGDKAYGYNFGAITCESCKSFYRRHAHRHVEFHCPSDGRCVININTRKYCPACRMKKCFNVGMKRPSTDETADGSSAPAASLVSQNDTLCASSCISVCSPISQRQDSIKTSSSNHTNSVVSDTQSNDSSDSHSTSADGVPAKIRRKHEANTGSKTCKFDHQPEPAPSEDINSVLLISKASVVDSGCSKDESIEYTNCLRQVDLAVEFLLSTPWQPEELGASDAEPTKISKASVRYAEVALQRYVRAVRLIDDFSALSHQIRIHILRKNLMEQFNIYSIMCVNDDNTGWVCVAPDGSKHVNHFEKFIAFANSFGISMHEYVWHFRKMTKFVRDNFPTDYPRIALMLCLLSASSLHRQVASGSLECLSNESAAAVKNLHTKYLWLLRRYLSEKYGLKSSAKMSACWTAMDLATTVGELYAVKFSEMLTGTPLPMPPKTETEDPSSPISPIHELQRQRSIARAATAIAPLLCETLLRSFDDEREQRV